MGEESLCTSVNNVAAVVVTYYPDVEALRSLMTTLVEQCGQVIVVDNDSNLNHEVLGFSHLPNVHWILLGSNMGVAKAHNVGINKAKALSGSHVLLMDQDSFPEGDMVERLLKTEEMLLSTGKEIAAVGPVQVDSRNGGKAPFISTEGLTVEKLYCDDQAIQWCRADFIISSGSLISMEVFDNIGLMEEPLFIDCVDIEWGFRAASKGYQCFGAFDAKMQHAIGDKPLSLFGKQITLHSPLRHYYFYRNLIVLCKRPYPKTAWKVHVLFKAALQFLIFSTLTDRRREHFSMIAKGVYHGFSNKLGEAQA